MAHESILIIEDDRDIQELLGYNLQREGYTVKGCLDAESAHSWLDKAQPAPDLILLDLMLPGIDGYAFCRGLRKDPRFVRIPVIMLTARNEDADIVAGLEVGADDYMTKPFSPRVLAARIGAVLRRCRPEASDASDALSFGGLAINRARHSVAVDGSPVELTLSEFKALDLFMRRPGIVFSRYQIIDEVHGEDYPATDRSVDVLIVSLRKKLGAFGARIETVRGVGYRLASDSGKA